MEAYDWQSGFVCARAWSRSVPKWQCLSKHSYKCLTCCSLLTLSKESVCVVGGSILYLLISISEHFTEVIINKALVRQCMIYEGPACPVNMVVWVIRKWFLSLIPHMLLLSKLWWDCELCGLVSSDRSHVKSAGFPMTLPSLIHNTDNKFPSWRIKTINDESENKLKISTLSNSCCSCCGNLTVV